MYRQLQLLLNSHGKCIVCVCHRYIGVHGNRPQYTSYGMCLQSTVCGRGVGSNFEVERPLGERGNEWESVILNFQRWLKFCSYIQVPCNLYFFIDNHLYLATHGSRSGEAMGSLGLASLSPTPLLPSLSTEEDPKLSQVGGFPPLEYLSAGISHSGSRLLQKLLLVYF